MADDRRMNGRLSFSALDAAVGGVIAVVLALIALVIGIGDTVDHKAVAGAATRSAQAMRQTQIADAVLNPTPAPTTTPYARPLSPVDPLPPTDQPRLLTLADDGLRVDDTAWIDGVTAFSPSPDGRFVAYSSPVDGLVVVEVITGGREASPCATRCPALTWRPGSDNRELALVQAVTPDSASVRAWLRDLADGDQRPLVGDALTTGERVMWSASGDRVLFHRPADGRGVVYDYRLRRAFVQDDGAGLSGVFSPDGDTLVFASCDETGCTVRYAGALAGRSRRLGTFSGSRVGGLAWLPDQPALPGLHVAITLDNRLLVFDFLTGQLVGDAVGASGGNATLPAQQGVTLGGLAVDPTGTRLAIEWQTDDAGSSVGIYDHAAGTFRFAAQGSSPAWLPAVSP